MGGNLSEKEKLSHGETQIFNIHLKTKCAAPSKLKAAQSVFLKEAEAPDKMATRACTRSSRQFVSRWSTGGQSTSGQHSNHFHNPRTLASAVPLGFCFGGFSSTSGYAPETKLNLRRAALLPSAGPCLRVPFVFIRMARESLATFSS
jgi:hypothetical protein